MKTMKKFARILVCLSLVFTVMAVLNVTVAAEAEPVNTSSENTPAPVNNNAGFAYIAAALSTGLAAIGAGIAVGTGAPAAIGALTEDPKSFGKALIFVALGEGIALYGMLISILLITKV